MSSPVCLLQDCQRHSPGQDTGHDSHGTCTCAYDNNHDNSHKHRARASHLFGLSLFVHTVAREVHLHRFPLHHHEGQHGQYESAGLATLYRRAAAPRGGVQSQQELWHVGAPRASASPPGISKTASTVRHNLTTAASVVSNSDSDISHRGGAGRHPATGRHVKLHIVHATMLQRPLAVPALPWAALLRIMSLALGDDLLSLTPGDNNSVSRPSIPSRVLALPSLRERSTGLLHTSFL